MQIVMQHLLRSQPENTDTQVILQTFRNQKSRMTTSTRTRKWDYKRNLFAWCCCDIPMYFACSWPCLRQLPPGHQSPWPVTSIPNINVADSVSPLFSTGIVLHNVLKMKNLICQFHSYSTFLQYVKRYVLYLWQAVFLTDHLRQR